MTDVILAPNPLWTAIDNNGQPVANGWVYTYLNNSDTNHATWQDAAGLIPNSNPVPLDGKGQARIYWDDSVKYRIEVYDGLKEQGGNLVYTQGNYPKVDVNTGGGTVTAFIDYDNYVRNAQFTFWTNGTSFDSDALGTESEIADGWVFERSNEEATVTIERKTFSLGQTDVPATPTYYFEYNCSGIGAGGETYKRIKQTYAGVQSLNNTQITVQFMARYTTTPTTLELNLYQHFGTGGTPSADVVTPVVSQALTTGWVKYYATVTLPSVAGKTLGDNGDDSLILAFDLPLDSEANVQIVNVKAELGDTANDFKFITEEEQYNQLLDSILRGYGDQQGTNIIGWSATETLHDYLISFARDSQNTNFLIGWDFIKNPNQFGETISSVNDGDYVCDQTILLSDGDGVVGKSSFIGNPLAFEVLQTSKKFGILQIIETINSLNLINQYVSILSELGASTSCTVKMAVLGWSGTVDQQSRDCVDAWNIAGTDPTLAAGWNYVSDVQEFTIDNTAAGNFNILENQLMDASSSFGMFIWVDSADLAVSANFYAYSGSLVKGANASKAQTLDFETVLSQCQRYYYRTYNYYNASAFGIVTNQDGPGLMIQACSSGGNIVIWPTTANSMEISSIFVDHKLPVEMFSSPDITVYNPTNGAEGSGRLYVSGVAPSSGSVNLTPSIGPGDNSNANIYFESATGTSYGFTGGTKNYAAVFYHLTADARLGI